MASGEIANSPIGRITIKVAELVIRTHLKKLRSPEQQATGQYHTSDCEQFYPLWIDNTTGILSITWTFVGI